jgi:hypothetical protein
MLALGGALLAGWRAGPEPEPAALSPSPAAVAVPAAAPPALLHSIRQPDEDLAERHRQLALSIETALLATDLHQRETAFNQLLPELLAADAPRLMALFARQEPGEARHALRDEITRRWIRQDRAAATEWMHSLDEVERRDSARTAMRALAAFDPPGAVALADEFGTGRDDGSVEQVLQLWAMEDPQAVRRWRAAE